MSFNKKEMNDFLKKESKKAEYRQKFKKKTCPNCGSDECFPSYKKDRTGYRSIYHGEIILCRECRSEFNGVDELIPGKEYFSIYGGYMFDSLEEMITDISNKLSIYGYKVKKK